MSVEGCSPKFFLGELVVYNKSLSAIVSEHLGVGYITNNDHKGSYEVYFEKKKKTLRFSEEVLYSLMREEK